MPKPPVKKLPQFVRNALVEQAVKGKVKEPDLAKLVSHFFDICGGEQSVARLLYQEFVAADPGSLARQRILDMLFRCLAKVTDRTPPDDDMGVLTDGDLEREILELTGEIESHGETGHEFDTGPPAAPQAEEG